MPSAAPSSGSDPGAWAAARALWPALSLVFLVLCWSRLKLDMYVNGGFVHDEDMSLPGKVLVSAFVGALGTPLATYGAVLMGRPRSSVGREVARSLVAAALPALVLFGCMLRVVDPERASAWGPATLLSPSVGAAGLALVVAWGALLAWRLRRPIEA